MKSRFFTKGFTLVEIIVAIAIFLVVAVVALGALLKIIDANKKSESIKTTMTNLNFALESMSRDIRTGEHYICADPEADYPTNSTQPFSETELSNDTNSPYYYPPTPCDPSKKGPWVLAFYSSNVDATDPTCKLIHAYYFNSFSLYKAEQSQCRSPYTFYPIVFGSSDKANANTDESSIQFVANTSIFGANWIRVVTGNTNVQPFVQIHLTGSSGTKEKNRTPFDLQTTISQRIND